MSENQRHSGGGSAFVLLLVVGFIVMFWWVIVAALGVLLLWGLALYASRCLNARQDARIALAARADQQHAWVLAGDERGTYGEYDPG